MSQEIELILSHSSVIHFITIVSLYRELLPALCLRYMRGFAQILFVMFNMNGFQMLN